MHIKKINGRIKSLVSCIVPVLNEKDTISGFISSLYNQDYRPIELIIVDGGSVDGTLEVINNTVEIFNDESFSIMLFKETDFGTITSPANARNIGLNAAKGEFIFFIDSDTRFINNSTINTAISEINDRDFIIIHFKPIIDTKLEDYISKTVELCGVVLYRRKLIESIRFTPTLGFGEDMEFYYRLFGDLSFAYEKPSSILIGRHYPHTTSELRRQNEWYGRTIVRYLIAIYPINKKEFLKQLSYVLYNIMMFLFPFVTIISLIFSFRITLILLLLFGAHILVRFLKYKWSTLDQFIFLLWYSVYSGLFFTKGLISSIYKKNIIGRKY